MAEKTRFQVPEKPAHPLGWDCANCFHVVKDPTPGSKSMKCCRHPPQSHPMAMQGGMQIVSINPPVNPGEWCGEYQTREHNA